MANWTVAERVFTVTAFIESKSITHVQRRFQLHFNVPRHGRVPSRNTILKWMRKFNETGSLRNEFVGSARRVRTPENIERVREAVIRSPQRSARRQAVALNLSRTSVCRILHEDLKFHPYKIQMVNCVRDADKPARLAFCRQFLAILNADPGMLNKLILSDEAHFHLSGAVNKQNFRYWSDSQPEAVHEKSLHSPKVTVWCGIIGPNFFEERGQSVTINAQRYQAMLTMLELPDMEDAELWFQQDGATAHTARETMNCLRVMFPGRIISRFGDVAWPPRSPDLTAPDYFLWGFLKSKVYCNKPRTTMQLKENIQNEIRAIDAGLLQRVMMSFQHRLQECVECHGGYLKNVIFKK